MPVFITITDHGLAAFLYPSQLAALSTQPQLTQLNGLVQFAMQLPGACEPARSAEHLPTAESQL